MNDDTEDEDDVEGGPDDSVEQSPDFSMEAAQVLNCGYWSSDLVADGVMASLDLRDAITRCSTKDELAPPMRKLYDAALEYSAAELAEDQAWERMAGPTGVAFNTDLDDDGGDEG